MNRRQMLIAASAAGAGLVLAPSLRASAGEKSRVYKIGACDWSIGGEGQVSALETARALGLHGVQVSFGAPGKGCDLRDPANREKYLNASKETGVEIMSLAMGCLNETPLATSDDAEKWVLDCIDVMPTMGQKKVLLAFFGNGDVKDKSDLQDQLITRLKRLAPRAEKAGVVLAIESWMSAPELQRMIDAVGSPAVQVYYDVANTREMGYDVAAEIRELGKKGLICECHCKENGSLLGQGKVDFPAIRAAMDEGGYEGWLVLEGAVPDGMSYKEAYPKNAAYLSSVFPVAGSTGSTAATAMGSDKLFKISLAEWSLHKMLFADELKNMDFPKYTKDNFDIHAVEYVNQFFKDKAEDNAYLTELKKRTADEGITNVLIMCDGEGAIGDPDEGERKKAVENHYKWITAAKFLGCHSIRVNAQSSGTPEAQRDLAADGLRRLSEFGKSHDINVIVENHGGLSSNGEWLVSVLKKVDMPNCGALPDFGNFYEYDRYQGVTDMMPFAKGVSAKSYDFDEKGEHLKVDYRKMLKIVLAAGYHGYIGVEYEGSTLSEPAGIKATRDLLIKIREEMS